MSKRFKSRIGHAACERSGAALVECAVLAPLLVILVLGTIDVGQYVNVGQVISNASREGARKAVHVDTTSASQVQAAVQTYMEGVYPDIPANTIASGLTVQVKQADGTVLSGNMGLTTGEAVVVDVAFTYDTVRWISGMSMLGSQTIQVETTMRRE